MAEEANNLRFIVFDCRKFFKILSKISLLTRVKVGSSGSVMDLTVKKDIGKKNMVTSVSCFILSF